MAGDFERVDIEKIISQETADLQHQLQQAQKERDRDTGALQNLWDDFHIVERARDAAKQDAAEQRALAGTRLASGLWLWKIIALAVAQKGVTLTVTSPIDEIDVIYMTRNQTERVAPAEPQGSPQSGQEEGEE